MRQLSEDQINYGVTQTKQFAYKYKITYGQAIKIIGEGIHDIKIFYDWVNANIFLEKELCKKD